MAGFLHRFSSTGDDSVESAFDRFVEAQEPNAKWQEASL